MSLRYPAKSTRSGENGVLPEHLASSGDRFKALSLSWSSKRNSGALPHDWTKQKVPTLVEVSIRALFNSPDDLCALLAYMPRHLQLRCSRYAALKCPEAFMEGWRCNTLGDFEGTRTSTFFETVAGVEGETIYVGNGKTSVPIRRYLESIGATSTEPNNDVESWEEVVPTPARLFEPISIPLTTLILAHIPLSSLSQLITLIPSTLTTLAFLSLVPSQPPSTYRAPREYWLKALSRKAPWLHIIDLSFNRHIGTDILDQLNGIDWSIAWKDLVVLGLRLVGITSESQPISKVERGTRSRNAFGALWYEPSDGIPTGSGLVEEVQGDVRDPDADTCRLADEDPLSVATSMDDGFADGLRTLRAKIDSARVLYGSPSVRIAY